MLFIGLGFINFDPKKSEFSLVFNIFVDIIWRSDAFGFVLGALWIWVFLQGVFGI